MKLKEKTKKCDFCTKSSPVGKCYWRLQSNRESDCEKAILRMQSILKGDLKNRKKIFSRR